MFQRKAALLLAFICLPCVLVAALARPNAVKQTPAPIPADTVLTNANIETMDDAHPTANAVAIRGEQIVAVSYASAGSATNDDVQKLIGPHTRVIDLHGQFVMPGFNDAHLHLANAAYAKIEVDVEGTKSLAEFQQRIRARLPEYAPGEWIPVEGWDHTLWTEKRFPTRQDLDAVSTKNPIIALRIDGHVSVANSLALQIAGITTKTPDPPGGRIERDPQTGEPTGMLDEDAARYLVTHLIPPYSRAKRLQIFEKLFNYIAQYGVTSVQEFSVIVAKDDDNYGWENFQIYQEIQRAGKLNIRITSWLPFELPLARLEQMRQEGGTGVGADGAWLKTGALKEIVDGSLGARTAAMLAPYSDDPNATGILRIPPDKLTALAIERDRAGFQFAFHAIGDRTNRVALDTFAAVLAANGPRDRRDRIEHAQVVATEDFARFAQLNVIASMQPSHLLTDQRWAIDRIGPERVKGAYAWRTMEKNGIHLAFGTDFPVESINPLRGIYSCVTRELPQGGPAGGWQPQEKLTMHECLSAYTKGSAYAEFEEKTKGQIAPGMLADIVIFPKDLNAIPPQELLTLPVTMTIAGGRITYKNLQTPTQQ